LGGDVGDCYNDNNKRKELIMDGVMIVVIILFVAAIAGAGASELDN
jgi:hypothetical protein